MAKQVASDLGDAPQLALAGPAAMVRDARFIAPGKMKKRTKKKDAA
jgi:hypothetical protein